MNIMTQNWEPLLYTPSPRAHVITGNAVTFLHDSKTEGYVYDVEYSGLSHYGSRKSLVGFRNKEEDALRLSER